MDEPNIIVGVDGKARCAWCAAHDDLIAYHDTEWGFPVTDDRRLFEKLSLEGFQSGLSWLTILRKRDAFRRAFADFDIEKVARFGSRHVEPCRHRHRSYRCAAQIPEQLPPAGEEPREK